MQPVVNVEQATAWNGYEGSHWADHHDRYDALNGGFNEQLLAAAAVGEPDRVLDVGCGTGQLTRLAAGRALGGGAVGVDLSAPMLQRAMALAAAEGIGNVRFERGDAQVHPLAAGAFDVATSRFGIMFFTDPVAAFANVGRALRCGGRLAVLSLQDMRRNELGDVLTALEPYLPPGEPDDAEAGSGPLSLSDPDRIVRVLTAAGFTGVDVRESTAPQVWGRDAEDAGAFLGAWGPVRHLLDQRDAATAAGARQALADAMRPFARPDGVRLRCAAWLTTATWPA